MTVGICDNDKLWCKKAEELIKKYAEKTKEEIIILNFYSVNKLEKYVGEPLDLIFMETVFEDDWERGYKKNGIWLGDFVNKKWKNCQVVYLTNHSDYITEVYCVDHIYYVFKSEFEKWIPHIMRKAARNLEKYEEKYLFSAVGGKHFLVKAEEIRYFERSGRITKVVTVWGTYEIWDKINDISERVSKMDFLRCHNSYMIYYPVIREIVYDKITLDSGKEIPISRSYRKNVKKEFAKWALTQWKKESEK